MCSTAGIQRGRTGADGVAPHLKHPAKLRVGRRVLFQRKGQVIPGLHHPREVVVVHEDGRWAHLLHSRGCAVAAGEATHELDRAGVALWIHVYRHGQWSQHVRRSHGAVGSGAAKMHGWDWPKGTGPAECASGVRRECAVLLRYVEFEAGRA